MTPQLPTPGGDDGTWGNILNNFLSVAHTPEGGLQPNAITAAGGYLLPAAGIPSTDMATNVQTSLGLANTSVQLGGDLGGTLTTPTITKLQGTIINASTPATNQVLTYNGSSWVPGTVTSSTINDATTSSKGIVELSGDLGGTASSPSVLKLNGISVSGTPATNQVLTATSTSTAQWATPPSNASTLAGDTDVTISGPSTNQVLAYNGTVSKWQNATLTEGDVTNLTSDLAAKVQVGGDLGGTATTPKVVSLNGGITLPGTAPSATGQVLTTTGTGASATTAWTTPATGVTLDTTVADIQPDTTSGTAVAGAIGRAADAGHQHPLVAHNHTTANMGGQIPIGGISATGTASSTTYLRGDGAWSAVSTNASSIDGVTVSGTPSSGQVLTATSGTAASWQVAGSGSGNYVGIRGTATTAAKYTSFLIDSYGADPTGAALSDSAFTAAYADATAAVATGTGTAAGATAGAMIELGPGMYKFSINTFQVLSYLIGVKGAGKMATSIYTTGSSGDCVYISDTTGGSGEVAAPVYGFNVIGWNAGASVNGFHYGDRAGGRLEDILVVGFTSTGSRNFLFRNDHGSDAGCEGTYARLDSQQGGLSCVTFDGSNANGTFDYSDWAFHIVSSTPNQSCRTIEFINQGHCNGGRLDVRGNIYSSNASYTNTVFAIGAAGSTTDTAQLGCSSITLIVEIDGSSDTVYDFKITGAAYTAGIDACQLQCNFLAAGGTITAGSIANNALLVAYGNFGNPIAPIFTTASGQLTRLGQLQSFETDGADEIVIDTTTSHISFPNGTAPTVALTAAAGSGATASVSGNDTSGLITLHAGSSGTTSGQLLTITLHTPFSTGTPRVVITPTTQGGAAMQLYANGVSTSTWTLGSNVAPSASTTYTFVYHNFGSNT